MYSVRIHKCVKNIQQTSRVSTLTLRRRLAGVNSPVGFREKRQIGICSKSHSTWCLVGLQGERRRSG